MNKKKWYDYLWIFSTTYLVLGFVNILFAWLGLVFFCTPLIVSIVTGNKGYCHRYCDRGQLFALLGGEVRSLPEEAHAPVDGVQMVPLRFSGLLYDHVPGDAVEHLPGLCRNPGPEAGGDPSVDH